MSGCARMQESQYTKAALWLTVPTAIAHKAERSDSLLKALLFFFFLVKLFFDIDSDPSISKFL